MFKVRCKLLEVCEETDLKEMRSKVEQLRVSDTEASAQGFFVEFSDFPIFRLARIIA